jgi:hypothetical protein
MNDNTILRIKVPAHLYESVKKQLTLNEANKEMDYTGISLPKSYAPWAIEIDAASAKSADAIIKKMDPKIQSTVDEIGNIRYAVTDSAIRKIAGTLNAAGIDYDIYANFVRESDSINEAKKGGHNYGSGMEVVKEKKMKTPPDGMKKVEKEVKDNKKKSHSLEELKDAHKKLSGKIEEMENTSINKADDQQASVEEIAAAMDKAVAFAKKLAQQIANKKGGSLTQKDFFRLIDNFRSKVKDFGPFKRD